MLYETVHSSAKGEWNGYKKSVGYYVSLDAKILYSISYNLVSSYTYVVSSS